MRHSLALSKNVRDIGALLICAVFLVGGICHFFHIDVLPMGFFVDEASIAYNAHLIQQTGADEHGVRWPLFFEAFGEYKNPLYIYLLAACYRILGYSEWTTRALSGFCWLAGTGFLYALVRRLTAEYPARLYAALSLAFTPWLFALSRISFELITLYPLLSLHLLALHRAFESNSRTWALVSGGAIGLCVYAYSTFRLLCPLHIALVMGCYFATRNRRAQIGFALGALVCFVPYALYAQHHFVMLTGRFKALTYLRDPTLTAGGKLSMFFSNYAGYFSPSFLAISGDVNRRHHTGFGGELLLPTALLLCLALVSFPAHWRDRFRIYLISGILVAPAAAALTWDSHHSLRAFSMVTFAIPLSVYGFSYLKPRIAQVTAAFTAVCAIGYAVHYFAVYPVDSIVAFRNYGFKEALLEAARLTRGRVVLLGDPPAPDYIDLLFFGTLEHVQVPLVMAPRSEVRRGDVYMFYDPTRSVRAGLFSVVDTLPPGAVTE